MFINFDPRQRESTGSSEAMSRTTLIAVTFPKGGLYPKSKGTSPAGAPTFRTNGRSRHG
jgi:hypothetical protein